MPQFESQAVEVLFYIVAGVTALVLLMLGFVVGKWIGRSGAKSTMQQREQELFTAQQGFRRLYENEIAQLKDENGRLRAEVENQLGKVEEYRKKAAGYGGLFNSGGKRADAMYALLLENEALEEALHGQATKLQQERTDSVKESIRSAGYRRVLMSQLMNDERIKQYVAEILADDKRLPQPERQNAKQLAHDGEEVDR